MLLISDDLKPVFSVRGLDSSSNETLSNNQNHEKNSTSDDTKLGVKGIFGQISRQRLRAGTQNQLPKRKQISSPRNEQLIPNPRNENIYQDSETENSVARFCPIVGFLGSQNSYGPAWLRVMVVTQARDRRAALTWGWRAAQTWDVSTSVVPCWAPIKTGSSMVSGHYGVG